MKPLLSILTFLFFFSGISPSLLPPQEFRFALLIGNADYEGTARLQNPINDIRRLSPLFQKYGFEVIKVENADQEKMGKAIDNFSKKIRETRQKYPNAQITTLFYYSGHGFSDEGYNYLIPISEELLTRQSLKFKSISIRKISDALSIANISLLFFDACRNTLPTRSEYRVLPEIGENQGLSKPTIIEPVKTFNQSNTLNGIFIGFATAFGERASDGVLNISPYAEAFAKELSLNPSSKISELFINIEREVRKSTNGKQIPWQNTTGSAGQFRFVMDNNVIFKEKEVTIESMNNLAKDYYFGKNGKNHNYFKAFELYNKTANRGNSQAQYLLGYMHKEGLGTKKDYKEAVKWYREAAKQGHSQAECQIGYMYSRGIGIEQNHKEAVKWYKKSAYKGNGHGQANLAHMYVKGYGVAKNYNKALKWYKKSVAQNNPCGQIGLGNMYRYGQGVKKSYSEFISWYRKAARQDFKAAQAVLKGLGKSW